VAPTATTLHSLFLAFTHTHTHFGEVAPKTTAIHRQAACYGSIVPCQLSLARVPYQLSLAQHSLSSHPTCDIPFPPRRTGIYRKGMISARPSCQRVKRSIWDPEPFPRAEARPTGHAVSKERLGDWEGPMDCLSPLVTTKARHMAKRRVRV